MVAELARGLPAGSQVAIGARTRPALPVALLRARGQVVEVGVAGLTMNQAEGRALLAEAGAGLADPEASELVGRTEGWPVGLYLAALANRAGGQPGNTSVAFTGDDRFLADYLQAELLAHLSPERVRFLTRTAVLERLCGPLCDAILATSGSDRVLAELEDSNCCWCHWTAMVTLQVWLWYPDPPGSTTDQPIRPALQPRLDHPSTTRPGPEPART